MHARRQFEVFVVRCRCLCYSREHQKEQPPSSCLSFPFATFHPFNHGSPTHLFLYNFRLEGSNRGQVSQLRAQIGSSRYHTRSDEARKHLREVVQGSIDSSASATTVTAITRSAPRQSRQSTLELHRWMPFNNIDITPSSLTSLCGRLGQMAASIGTAPPGGSSEDGRRPERNGRIPIQLLLSSSSDGGESAPGHHRPLTQEYPRERHSGASVGSSHGSSIPVSVIVNPSHSDGYTTGPREPIRVEQANGHRTSSGRQSFELEDVAWTSADFTRRPRAPRPSYSEEQKFFIM